MPPDVRFLGQKAQNSISAEAPPPDPTGEAYSAGFKGPTSKRREEEKGERKGDGRKEEGPDPQIFWCRTAAGGPISS